MPIYEYDCQKCGTFETTQKITEKPLSKCPTCKGKVKKLISNTSFQLKGTGWYVTDYGRKNSGSDSKGSSTDDSTGSKESKASDSDSISAKKKKKTGSSSGSSD